MHSIKSLLAGLLLTLPLALLAEPLQQKQIVELTAQDLNAWLDGHVDATIRNQNLAGLTLVVVKNGEVLLSKGFGYADIETKREFDPNDTLVRPGSISKLFTWTAVMQLVEQGKLELDRDINDYLDFKIPEHSGGPITMRHLMTHRSGFEDSIKGLFVHDTNEMLGLSAWLQTFMPDRVFPVDTTAAYSNYATGLAGYIVERVSGLQYAQYVDSFILKPLEMKNSTFIQPLPDALEKRAASSYMTASDPKESFELVAPAPAGALTTSAADMGLFLKELLSSSEDTKLMSQQTKAQMMNYEAKNLPEMKPMALGFLRSDRNGHKILSHGGDTRYFHSDLILLPEHNVGLFYSISGSGKDFYAARFRADLTDGFIDRHFPPQIASEIDSFDDGKNQTRIDQIVGNYQISRANFSGVLAIMNPFTQMKIYQTSNHQLAIDAFVDGTGKVWEWREIRPNIWHQIGGKAKLSFVPNSSGDVLFTVDSASPAIQWLKVTGLNSGAFWLPILGLSCLVVIFHVLATVSGWLTRRYYKIAVTTNSHELGYKSSSFLYVVILFQLGIAATSLQNFENADLAIRVAQAVLGLAALITSLYCFKVMSARLLSGQYLKSLITLVILTAHFLILFYLSYYNVWSARLNF